MAKTLKEILEVYEPKSPDEKRFKDKHITAKTKDRNGNGDDVFQATNVKVVDRKKENHGYNPGDDEKVYEAKDSLASYEKRMGIKPSKAKPSWKKEGEWSKDQKKKMKAVEEATMTDADKAKEKKLKSKYDKSGMKSAMKKQYGSEKGETVYFSKIRKMAMEEVDYLNESVAQMQYDTHHTKAMKSLGNMMKHLDKHKKLCSKNSAMSWHAYDMKTLARQLEDMEHDMANKNESQEMLNTPPMINKA
jgi:hypothetical protein